MLDDFPPPPEGLTGWPWNFTPQLYPPCRINGSSWPRITVVTPSYNQGEFIEETIRAVLLQGYPNLEYIVIDGGSTDHTVEIIKKYEKWLAYWVSEPDRGQSHALNKGFAIASGDILAWLNSDDRYLPGALKIVAESGYMENSGTIVYGNTVFDGYLGKSTYSYRSRQPALFPLLFHWLVYNRGVNVMPSQPSVFFPGKLFRNIGELSEDLHLAMDHDLWLRAMISGYTFRRLDRDLSIYRFHDTSKSWQGWHAFVPDWRLAGIRNFRALGWCRQVSALSWLSAEQTRYYSKLMYQRLSGLRRFFQQVR